MFEHADSNLIDEEYGPTNQLRVTITPEGNINLRTQPVQATPHQLKNILNLAIKMQETADYRIDKFRKKYMKKINERPGEYILDTKNENTLLTRMDAEQEV